MKKFTLKKALVFSYILIFFYSSGNGPLAVILRNFLYLPKIKHSLYFRKKLPSSENREKLLRKNVLFREIEPSKFPWKKVNAWVTIRLSWFLVSTFSIHSASLIRHLPLTQWGCSELPNVMLRHWSPSASYPTLP